MNGASLAVLAILFALVALAVRYAWKRGAPCSCGCHGCGKCTRCGK